MCHFVKEADDIGILEELLKNSERNPAKSKDEIVYKPTYFVTKQFFFILSNWHNSDVINGLFNAFGLKKDICIATPK